MKKYSDEIKARAIALVMENGLTPSQVAVKTLIPATIIKGWVKGLTPEPSLPSKPLELMDEDETDQHFIQTTFKAKLAAVNRMLILIKKEQNLSRVSDALKALHSITEEGEQDTGVKSTFNMYVNQAVMAISPEINRQIATIKKGNNAQTRHNRS